MDLQPLSVGALSILPPVIAVVLALVTKEVFSSLIIGILSGTLIYTIGTDGNIVLGTIQNAMTVMGHKFDLNIVLFCSLLGALVYVIYMAGASRAYGNWAAAKIKGRRSALLSTSALGAFIFIDDYFNCLTVGTVMRPITDRYRISRSKLAYIIDATAAPICIIAPVSSWAAAVGSNLKSTNAFDSDIGAFVSAIPWNFYALLCILMVFLVCVLNIDFGPMTRAEKVAENSGSEKSSDVQTTTSEAEAKIKTSGTVYDMVVPILSLIVFATLAMLYVGGYFGEDPAYHSIGAAFGNTDSSASLVLGSLGALFVAFLMMVPRRLLTLKEFMDGVLHGVQAMIPANMILTFAWTISGVTRDLLQAPEFISSIVQNDIGFVGAVLPAIIFIIAGFLSFSTGTAWGTFGILIPIVVTVAQAIDPSGSELVIISLSATLAGSVFGDHCSPISDTTVLSSAGAGCVHIEHVYTQLPYALTVASASLVGYIVAGFTHSLALSFGTALVLLLGAVFVFRRRALNRIA
ncbi:MAG: Na+/H+ antiporter NhaC family protein [Succinivibrio sp.]